MTYPCDAPPAARQAAPPAVCAGAHSHSMARPGFAKLTPGSASSLPLPQCAMSGCVAVDPMVEWPGLPA
eukprot:5849663-Alexandrium_andersonii.AAC.1